MQEMQMPEWRQLFKKAQHEQADAQGNDRCWEGLILGLELVLEQLCQNSKHKPSYHQHNAFLWQFDYAETVAEVSALAEILHWPLIDFTFIRLGRDLPYNTIW